MQSLDDPRLAAVLGEQPAGGVHDERRDDGPGRDPQEHREVSSFLRRHNQSPHSARSGTSDPEVGHHAHRPVLDEHVGDVVTGAVLLLVLRLELVEPGDLPVPRPGGQDRQQVRDLR